MLFKSSHNIKTIFLNNKSMFINLLYLSSKLCIFIFRQNHYRHICLFFRITALSFPPCSISFKLIYNIVHYLHRLFFGKYNNFCIYILGMCAVSDKHTYSGINYTVNSSLNSKQNCTYSINYCIEHKRNLSN